MFWLSFRCSFISICWSFLEQLLHFTSYFGAFIDLSRNILVIFLLELRCISTAFMLLLFLFLAEEEVILIKCFEKVVVILFMLTFNRLYWMQTILILKKIFRESFSCCRRRDSACSGRIFITCIKSLMSWLNVGLAGSWNWGIAILIQGL